VIKKINHAKPGSYYMIRYSAIEPSVLKYQIIPVQYTVKQMRTLSMVSEIIIGTISEFPYDLYISLRPIHLYNTSRCLHSRLSSILTPRSLALISGTTVKLVYPLSISANKFRSILKVYPNSDPNILQLSTPLDSIPTIQYN